MPELERIMKESAEQFQKVMALPLTVPLALGNAFIVGGEAVVKGQNPFEVTAKVLEEAFRPLTMALPPEVKPLLEQVTMPLKVQKTTTQGGEYIGTPDKPTLIL